ncbi:MAG: hypothetical protein U0835_12385 [Isosphaeraceae bacterium]
MRILPAQSGVTAVCETVCGFDDAYKHADALAIAPYMGYTLGRGELKDHGPVAARWGVDRLLDDFEARAFPDSVARMKASKAVADRFGLRLVAYEGGQHMVALTPDRALNEKLSGLFMEANRHPRMGEIYTRYYDAWERAGGDLFATFASVAKWSVHGCWGLSEYADEPPSRCPKLRATLAWARRAGQAVPAV